MYKNNDTQPVYNNGMDTEHYSHKSSLVELQQLRKQLQRALVGHRVMKWKTLATGRELKRIGDEINKSQENFIDDFRNAYILLARSRYFFEDLNKIVIEDVQKQASTKMMLSKKYIAGVEIVKYGAIDVPPGPYCHLGVAKGGQTIREAKAAWLALLKRIIGFVYLNSSYEQLQAAHRKASKRKKILESVIIPRTQSGIRYILAELEDQYRYESYKFKKIKEKKLNKGIGFGRKLYVCTNCHTVSETNDEVEDPTCLVCKAELKNREIEMNEMKESPRDTETLEDTKERLQVLTSNIDNVIDLTKQYKQAGFVGPSLEELIKYFNLAKEKIESYATVNSGFNKSMEDTLPSQKDNAVISADKSKTFLSENTDHISLQDAVNFGLFENKVKEIVKIIRWRNKDGTVTEEQQVVTIKSDTRNPQKSHFNDNSKSKNSLKINDTGKGNFGKDGDRESKKCKELVKSTQNSVKLRDSPIPHDTNKSYINLEVTSVSGTLIEKYTQKMAKGSWYSLKTFIKSIRSLYKNFLEKIDSLYVSPTVDIRQTQREEESKHAISGKKFSVDFDETNKPHTSMVIEEKKKNKTPIERDAQKDNKSSRLSLEKIVKSLRSLCKNKLAKLQPSLNSCNANITQTQTGEDFKYWSTDIKTTQYFSLSAKNTACSTTIRQNCNRSTSSTHKWSHIKVSLKCTSSVFRRCHCNKFEKKRVDAQSK